MASNLMAIHPSPAEGEDCSDTRLIHESIEIASDTNEWSTHVGQEYYLHLPDGNYGRVNFTLACSASPFFGVEAFINPAGSKDLEYVKGLSGNILIDRSSP
jgi:hypothetical protein